MTIALLILEGRFTLIIRVRIHDHSSPQFTGTAFSPPSSRLCSNPSCCVVLSDLSPPSELGCSCISFFCVCSSCASCFNNHQIEFNLSSATLFIFFKYIIFFFR
ncbi:hypothetical protein AHAS_Ahas17G0113000 [Arachis hypogaea]